MKQRVLTYKTKRRTLLLRAVGAVLTTTLLAIGAGPFPILSAPPAHAENTDYAPGQNRFESTAPATEIEIATDAYEKALSTALACNAKASVNQMHIDLLEARIPAQQARCDASMVELYKMQKGRFDILEMLLESRTLDDFVKQTEYIECISRANLKAINALGESLAKLDKARASLSEAKAEADATMAAAREALEAERSARAARQAAGAAGSGVSWDGADWNMTEEEFVAAWAPRIDAYLAGSALDGQGATFARASWRYCVDPRWSPAISNTESSKGAKCIRPHNAWGWGAADSNPYGLASEWGSWEEAIDAHVKGLSSGFGYTISTAAAKGYCPGTWESWYQATASEMARI